MLFFSGFMLAESSSPKEAQIVLLMGSMMLHRGESLVSCSFDMKMSMLALNYTGWSLASPWCGFFL